MADSFDSWLDSRPAEDAPLEGELLPGTAVDDYRIVALLGRGGFAEVYRARDAAGRAVAIKMLHRLDDTSRARFKRESDILMQIRHPNVERLLAFGCCGNRPYLVTELLKPCELPHADRRVAAFMRKIISAVAELHRCGYLHRDISPSNILMREDGEPVLIDFGLACPIVRERRDGESLSIADGRRVCVGTPGYSAPEQFNGSAADRTSDVHALGALAGKCFSGKLPRDWARIILVATNSNKDVRYATVERLDRVIVWRHWKRNLAVVLAVAALVLTLFLALTPARQDAASELENMPHELPPSDKE